MSVGRFIDPEPGWDRQRMRDEEAAERAAAPRTCAKCGSFLPKKPDREIPWEDKSTGPDGKPYLIMAGVTQETDCKRCGFVNKVE